MSTPATLVVLPSYQAQIFGFSAIKIGARKLTLCDGMLRTIASRHYGHAQRALIADTSTEGTARLARYIIEGV